jgi:phosphoserine phosphatase RsbU/P
VSATSLAHASPPPLRAILARDATARRYAWRPAAIAAAAGVVAFFVGTAAESVVVRAVRGDVSELGWISDAVLSVCVAAMAFPWLHLRASRARVLKLERDQAALDEQARLGAEIQRNLLPDLPARTLGFRWAARMVPAERVGGDFYDFVEPSPGSALVILGDVSGKGIPTAIVQSWVKALFRMIVRDTTDPAAIAEHMALGLHELTAGIPYATAIVARFDQAPARLAYVNAGHPSGLLLRDGQVVLLESCGPPLGLLQGSKFATREVGLLPGDVGLLVTDGVTEALESTPKALAEWLAQNGHSAAAARLEPAEMCEHVLRMAAEGPGPVGVRNWQDDRTALVCRVEPAARRRTGP